MTITYLKDEYGFLCLCGLQLHLGLYGNGTGIKKYLKPCFLISQAMSKSKTMKKVINVVSFFIMIALARIWIKYDQDFLPAALLMPVFIIIMLVLMTLYFFVVKPKNKNRFELIFSLSVLPIAIVLSLYQHLIVNHDFSAVWKQSIIIWCVSFIMPFVAGFVYQMIKNMLSS